MFMPLTASLPRRLAVIGIIVGFGFMAASWYVYKYNPFHLPTEQQAEKMGNFSEPPLSSLFDDLTFVFCPGSFLFFFTMDMSDATNYATWIMVALINGPVYYCVGMIFAALMRRRSRVSVR
jgi:uncharacterized membrane protein